jgi:NAD(P)-dependent dehydrogenase (short-subunit alcohol dehydrogenase family)
VRDFRGKAAFVTGGASGIGLALGRAFAKVGCRVMLADIEEAALADAVRSLERIGPEIRGVVCDVADSASVEAAAEQTSAAFGRVHILCNNAGVAGGSGIDDISLASWRWVLDVNLMGVVHGLRAFLPHMRGHLEGGHIVNTASMAGMLSDGGMGLSPYTASKYAVVALSEGLRAELEPHGIGVTVLCPGFVQTRIAEAGRNRPARYGTHAPVASPRSAAIAELVRTGIDPKAVAERVLAAIRDDELYVFTHPEYRQAVEARFAGILAAFDAPEGESR